MTTSRGLSPPRSKASLKSTASTPNIRKMAAVAPHPGLPHANSTSHFRLGSEAMSTLRDPRSTGDLREASAATAAELPLHPDLSLEVAALSNKLINAINNQTRLDDALATAREELQGTQERLQKAEQRNAEWDSLLKDGRLLRKSEFDETVNDLLRKLSNEKQARDLADREKRAIEMELADLSTKLFEEANELVGKARKETQAADQRTDHVRGQLSEAEVLLSSQQEQLVQLKAILEKSTDQADTDAAASTAPSTPALGAATFDQARSPDTAHFGNGDRPDPAAPMTYSHLISPVLRSDVPAYEDFRGLLEISRKAASAPGSRVTSGSYGGLNIPSLAQSPAPTNSSQTNLGTNSPQPHSPSNSSSMPGSMYSPTTYLPMLRETKFFKRALAEDIEPTLRLDAAPGLSYFNRRSVSTAINDNTLILEPLPSSTRKLITSCTLCGERRRGDIYARTHRFKTGDDSAQWYPLCAYCVTRFRAVCDYIAFLRMVRDGFWRCDGKEAEDKAWEESVRLREAMFWARIGGGVVPANSVPREDGSTTDSQRPSIEADRRRPSKDNMLSINGIATPVTETPPQTAATEQSASDSDSITAAIEETIQNIKELPSTAPPLQASMLPPSEAASRHMSSDSTAAERVISPRVSIADSLRRISLRDSLRFGSRSRNASSDRAAAPAAVASPRLNAVEESRPAEAVAGISEKQPDLEQEPIGTQDFKVPGGF